LVEDKRAEKVHNPSWTTVFDCFRPRIGLVRLIYLLMEKGFSMKLKHPRSVEEREAGEKASPPPANRSKFR
jgi:hypothetical protein